MPTTETRPTYAARVAATTRVAELPPGAYAVGIDATGAPVQHCGPFPSSNRAMSAFRRMRRDHGAAVITYSTRRNADDIERMA